MQYGDPDGEPDIAKAKELVKESGYEGEKVTVWTNNKDPRPAIADYYRDMLTRLVSRPTSRRSISRCTSSRSAQADQGPDGLHRLVPGLPAPR